jgi:Zn-finger nucleic acid-binding protein
MNCPVCKAARLQPDDLEPSLNGRLCPHCRGHWIPFAEYLPWAEAGAPTGDSCTQGETSELFSADGATSAAEAPAAPHAGASATSGGAKVRLCPECGRFLRRYPLGMGIEFEVERCGGCAGVWLDRGKWARLRAAGAHARLHLLFSDAWQLKIKEEQIRKRQEDRVRSILGEADFERARTFKAWIDAHPHRGTIRAILDEDFDEKAPPSTR